MKKNNHLRELINSLSRSEKRYVKLSGITSGGKDQKTYLKLFDLISDGYQNDEIKSKLGSRYGSQLSKIEKYLYDQIMRSMQQYHQNSSLTFQLNRMISDIDFLTKKGLYKQALIIIYKAKKIAKKYELLPELYNILIREVEFGFSIDYPESHSTVSTELSRTMNLLGIQKEYENLRRELVYLESKSKSRLSKNDKSKVEKIINSKKLKSFELAETFESKRSFYECHIRHGYITENYVKALKNSHQLVKLLENNPEQITKSPHAYLGNALMHQLYCYRQLNEYTKVYEIAEKARKLLSKPVFKKDPSQQAEVLFHTYSMELVALINVGETNKLKSVATKIEQVLVEHSNYIPLFNVITTYYNLAHAAFMLENYRETIRLLNKMFGLWHKVKLRDDVFIAGKFLNLLAHYELGNKLHLPYAAKSTLYFLRKDDKLRAIEREVLKAIKSFADTSNLKQQEKIYTTFLERLQLINDKHSRWFINRLLLIQWLESKVQNKALHEVVAQSAKSYNSDYTL